eukprot:TRINITY_DN3671_c0_g1_i1.p1 TRINITY_DN3671_c0_g1~~TRINITY_DN3671_c0_g1_i1.p1  ORF type:complete len:428 (-),score=93.30 TRINITY_DN3671_c0_g1_i1:270-1553(-)
MSTVIARKHRKGQLKYLGEGEPFSGRGDGLRRVVERQERLEKLEAALGRGDVEKMKSLTAIVGHDPFFKNNELVMLAQGALRQYLQCRKTCKENQALLESSPLDYPCEQVEANLQMLKSFPIGTAIWDDEILARANILSDLGLLKLLRSLRPRPDGFPKVSDLLKCARTLLALTESRVMSRQILVTISRLFAALPGAGAAFAAALAEPELLLTYTGAAQLASITEGFWRLFWSGGNLNKESDLALQLVFTGAASGLADLQPLLGKQVRGRKQGILVRASIDVLEKVESCLRNGDLEVTQAPETPEEQSARLAGTLQSLPVAVLVSFCRQDFLATVMRSCTLATVAAILQICAKAARTKLILTDASEDEGTVLSACLEAAAASLSGGAGVERDTKSDQATRLELECFVTNCASILESYGKLAWEEAAE